MDWEFLDHVLTRVIRVAGLLGVCWEAFYEHVDRPYLLYMFACMMGIARLGDITRFFKNGERE